MVSEPVIHGYEPGLAPGFAPWRLPAEPIPRFPEFKMLGWADRPCVEEWAGRFPPYSDFNFLLMWCWHDYLGTELSWLNGNLVMRFADYSTGEYAYSLLGVHALSETVAALLAEAGKHGHPARLRLVPEVVVTADDRLGEWFDVAEDEANVDHVLSTAEWSVLAGGKFRNKRYAIRQLHARHTVNARPLSLAEHTTRQAVLAVFAHWAARQPCPDASRHERAAFQRFLALGDDPRLICLGLEVDGVLRGFTINELLPGGYVMGHVMKADLDMPGVSPALLQATCRALHERGYSYLNIMQDLGDPGIAHAKRLCRPVFGLRKFTIAPRPDHTVD